MHCFFYSNYINLIGAEKKLFCLLGFIGFHKFVILDL